MMSASVFSQTTLPVKTVYQGENAIIISEAHMDSINLMYLRFKVLTAKNDQFKVKLALMETKIQEKDLTINYLTKDKKELTTQHGIYEKRIINLNQKHQTEIDIYQAKLQNRIWVFLSGTVVGALIVMVVALL